MSCIDMVIAKLRYQERRVAGWYGNILEKGGLAINIGMLWCIVYRILYKTIFSDFMILVLSYLNVSAANKFLPRTHSIVSWIRTAPCLVVFQSCVIKIHMNILSIIVKFQNYILVDVYYYLFMQK